MGQKQKYTYIQLST